MAASTVTLRRRETVATNTMAFHFDRPPDFRFEGGQSVELTLLEPTEMDEAGSTRTLSIASGPQDEELVVATRLRDTAFKRGLAALPIGAAVQIEGPYGSFTLHHNAARPAVFLAGGIGITPFRSLVRQAVTGHLPHALYLFYANHGPEDAAFLADLQALAAAHPTFHFIPTMTGMTGSGRPWDGATGRIDQAMLSGQLSSLNGPIYYIAGPPAMVTDLRAMLSAAGIDPDDMRSEEFAGY